MIHRLLLMVFVSIMIFGTSYSYAKAPEPEVKSRNGWYHLEKGWEYKPTKDGLEIRKIRRIVKEKKNIQFKKKPKQKKRIQSYIIGYSSYSRLWQNKFPWGYCTWLVAKKFPVTWSGNANMWIANARAQGHKISNKPKVGSIVQTREGRIGHVAYVVKTEKTRFQVI